MLLSRFDENQTWKKKKKKRKTTAQTTTTMMTMTTATRSERTLLTGWMMDREHFAKIVEEALDSLP
jgi:hypothetical protein